MCGQVKDFFLKQGNLFITYLGLESFPGWLNQNIRNISSGKYNTYFQVISFFILGLGWKTAPGSCSFNYFSWLF